MCTLKSQGVTRWSCRYEAVKSVIEQLPHIVETLLCLSDDRDPKTYADSTGLLNAIADFNFLFGLVTLKIILSNTNSLPNYLQGKTIDVITASRTASVTIETLASCRNEISFESVWECAEKIGRDIQRKIEDTRFTFKEARVPRRKKVPQRLLALVGESSTDSSFEENAKAFHRVSTFYPGLDKGNYGNAIEVRTQ